MTRIIIDDVEVHAGPRRRLADVHSDFNDDPATFDSDRGALLDAAATRLRATTDCDGRRRIAADRRVDRTGHTSRAPKADTTCG